MGTRDPLGGSSVTTGGGYDSRGGPLGAVVAAVYGVLRANTWRRRR